MVACHWATFCALVLELSCRPRNHEARPASLPMPRHHGNRLPRPVWLQLEHDSGKLFTWKVVFL